MKRYLTYIGAITVVLLISLFPRWNFDERIKVERDSNPLWRKDTTPISSTLTTELINEGLDFSTGRGAEADPDGICYGDFESDEYWVVQYNAQEQEVDAHVWIIGVNWIDYLKAKRRFKRIETILKTN